MIEKGKVWQPVGFCLFCVRPIEAQQPGGHHPRHVEDRTPLCKKRKGRPPEPV